MTVRRPTLREVAAAAGVSIKTVSRVVNDEPGVSEPLAQRVQRATTALGYRPDMAASNLRRSDRRTATIGLLLADVSNPFSAALLRAVEDVARPRGVAVVAASVDEDEERERSLVDDFVARRVDGLLVTPTSQERSPLARERQSGLPVVFIDREPPMDDADAVLVDNTRGARAATEHLLAIGHRRIAFLGDSPTISTAQQRLAGYRSALRRHGIRVDRRLYRLGPSSEELGYGTTMEMLDGPDPPSAVFAGQNLLTMGALRALSQRGLRSRVAVVGFDDFPLADLLDPPVTVVAQDVAALGRAAAELLFARMDGDTSRPRRLVLPTQLVPRGSGEIRPPRWRRRSTAS